MLSDMALEIALVDINIKKAQGDAVDMMHGISYMGPSQIYQGDYPDCNNADIIIITAGVNQKEGESRTDLLKRNSRIFKQILEEIVKYCTKQKPIILVVTNPVDILTRLTYQLTGFDRHRVIGSGTSLDSSRFKLMVSEHTGINPKSIHAYVIGEHGDTSVAAWSRTSIAGVTFEEYCGYCRKCDSDIRKIINDKIRNAAYEVIEQKGSTYYAIAVSVKRIVESILRDEHAVLTVSSVLDGEYGIYDVALSLPLIIGKNGIEKILSVSYSEDELSGLLKSAEHLRNIQNI